jgi:uncharacterized protein
MTEQLPFFRYHPDPLATGAIEKSNVTCVCCGKARGMIYVGSVYSKTDLDGVLCPWCIADGSAASKFHAAFADSNPLIRASVPSNIVEEVHLRTPAYISWQQEHWLAHCNDACEFHGDASVDDVQSASEETKMHWMAYYHKDDADWKRIIDGYVPGGDSALYKFVCRHCGLVLFGWDLS